MNNVFLTLFYTMFILSSPFFFFYYCSLGSLQYFRSGPNTFMLQINCVLYILCLTHCHFFVLLYSITDAFNETKDKVKYLESLHKYFDQLHVGNSLVNICSNTLPGLMASVRQMDAISRYYARSGYLGLLFSKVGSNGHFTVKPG